MNKLELSNINIKYNDIKVINDLSCKINKGDILTVLASSGKSSIVKIFKKEIEYKGIFKINGVEITKTNDYLIDRFIHVIDNKRDNNKSKVIDVLFDSLNEFKYSNEEEKEIINDTINFFNIDYLDERLNNIDDSKYFYIKVICSLLKMYDFIVFDNVLCYLNKRDLDKVFEYIENKKIGVLNLTNNINEMLYSNYAIFIYNGSVSMEGDILSCLKEEKLLKRLGYNLPFIYDLSLQLSYYNVINGPLLDEEMLVKEIWN